MAKYEILMAGTGGQGLVFVSSFLAEAGILDGKNVAQSQSYGISQRGGFISAEVIIDDDEILYQQVLEPNIIIALNDVVGTRYDAATAPVLYDSGLMHKRDFPGWVGLPFTHIAEEIHAPKAANLVALGAAYVITPFVSLEALTGAARKKFAPAVAELNIAAIMQGVKAAERAVKRV